MKINRRNLLQALGMSPALLAGSPAKAQEKTTRKTGSAAEAQLVGLNPKGMPPAITRGCSEFRRWCCPRRPTM